MPFVIFLLALMLCLPSAASDLLFEPVDAGHDVLEIRSINQLPDGRMIFVTRDHINIYDGAGCRKYALFPDSSTAALPEYRGFMHLYTQGDSLIWVKDAGRISSLDLRLESYRTPPAADDFFIDSYGNSWICRNDSVVGNRCAIPSAAKGILDVAASDSCVFLFYESGAVDSYSLESGEKIYSSRLFSPAETADFGDRSLVVPGAGAFYAIRNGRKGGFFRFDPHNGSAECIVDDNLTLNTLTVSRDLTAYISCRRGLWQFDLSSGEKTYDSFIRTVSGNMLATEISSVFADSHGGIWLGTMNRGILYAHPGKYSVQSFPAPGAGGFGESLSDGKVYFLTPSGSFLLDSGSNSCTPAEPSGNLTEAAHGQAFIASDNRLFLPDNGKIRIYTPRPAPQNYILKPVITALYVNGEKIRPGGDISLSHDRNSISVEFASLDYAGFRRNSPLVYTLEGYDGSSQETTPADAAAGIYRVEYRNLPSGRYFLRASIAGGPAAGIGIEIRPPFQKTAAAFILYGIAAIGAALIVCLLVRNRNRRRHREEELLVRIRSLIEQVERFKTESKENGEYENEILPDAKTESDRRFLQAAVQNIEKNIGNSGYSVAQLALDMCMDRTGLYRRLIALVDKSPSLFIRSVRLRRAADILGSHPGISIAEVAEMTGYSSGSYLSKCFQDEFGCKPSEYASKHRKST